MDTVIRHLRRAVLRQDVPARTDGQLLASFIEQRDEAAFEALVHRHGPMVFGVCRRVVGNHHDADDAFQATFLVLARRAASVRPRERVANWLHGVALRTAMKVKAMTAKRWGREKQVADMPEPEAVQQDEWRELQPLLDQELNGLPEKYRLPILLCDLEGKTIKEAAQQLGWPQGTLAGRLARGRKLLAKRLASRGVVLSAGSLATVISQNVASASVPTSLMSSTVKAATMIAAGQAAVAGAVPVKIAALMEGVMKAMLITKLKTVTAVLLVIATVGIGGGLLSRSTTRAAEDTQGHRFKGGGAELSVSADAGLTGGVVVNEQNLDTGFRVGVNSDAAPTSLYIVPFVDSGTVGSPLVPAETQAVAPKTDLDRLQGVWSVLSIEQQGRKPAKLDKAIFFMVDGKRACWQASDWEMQGGLYLDPTSEPKTYDLATSTRTIEGIYALDGDTLRLCYDLGNESKRPGGFTAKKGSQQVLVVLKRTHGPEVFPFRLADGTRAFPTLIERAQTKHTPPVLITPQPEANEPVPYHQPTEKDTHTGAAPNDKDALQGTWAYTGRGWQGNVTEELLRQYPDEKWGRVTFSDGQCAYARAIDAQTSQVRRLNYTLETIHGRKSIVFQLKNLDPRMPPIPKYALTYRYLIQGDKLTLSLLVHPVAQPGDPPTYDPPQAVWLHSYFKREAPAPKTRK
jgi:RNA polymerase sigma factor (sigma-70 family)